MKELKIEIPKEKEAELINSELSILDQKFNLTIKNYEDFSSAASDLKAIKQRIDVLEDKRKELLSPIEDARKKINNFFSGPILKLKKLETSIKQKMLEFTAEKERERKEQEQKLIELQEKEKHKLLKKAELMEQKGNFEKAEYLKNSANFVSAVVVPKQPIPQGIGFRKDWDISIVDEKVVPREYLTVDEKKIKAVVRATDGKITIPGVVITQKQIVAVKKDKEEEK